MSFVDYTVRFHIPFKEGLYHEETGTQVYSVPGYVLDEDADRPINCPESESPLHIYVSDILHRMIGNHAELGGFEPVEKVLSDLHAFGQSGRRLRKSRNALSSASVGADLPALMRAKAPRARSETLMKAKKITATEIDQDQLGMCIEQLMMCVADEDDWTDALETAARKAATLFLSEIAGGQA